MRRLHFGVVLGTLLVLGLIAGRGWSETPSAVGSSNVPYQSTSNLITHVPPAEGGPQAIVVVDPATRVLAVYHVDKTTGEIALRSVRNVSWDLQMMEFNSGKPLPQEIRNMRNELQR
jgi:hypothetical protein